MGIFEQFMDLANTPDTKEDIERRSAHMAAVKAKVAAGNAERKAHDEFMEAWKARNDGPEALKAATDAAARWHEAREAYVVAIREN